MILLVPLGPLSGLRVLLACATVLLLLILAGAWWGSVAFWAAVAVLVCAGAIVVWVRVEDRMRDGP